MKKKSILVFDETIAGNATVYTSSLHNSALGDFDQVSLQVTVDSPNANGYIGVQLQHSADELTFVDKGALIVDSALTADIRNTLTGADDGISPSLRFVRLAITLVAPTTKAHVKIHATLRDRG